MSKVTKKAKYQIREKEIQNGYAPANSASFAK